MSDNSNSAGSSASSTNSWTLLSPEEAAVENVGPVDDGTESLGDVPSLSEEVAGAALEFRPSDIPVETVLSEEGHQVCQETSPESIEGLSPPTPTRMSPLPHNPLDPPDLDSESQPPVIHEIDTSSPNDNDPLGAVPFVTNINLGAPLDIPELPPSEFEESCSAPPMTDIPVTTIPAFDTPVDVEQILVSPVGEIPVFTEPEVNIPAETVTAPDPPPHADADISFARETTEVPSPDPESLVAKEPTDESPAPETVGSVETEEEEEAAVEKEETWETGNQYEREEEEAEEEDEPSISYDLGDASGFDDGLRRRNAPAPFEGPRPRTSDEDDEDEEVEFKLAEKEEKPWLSMNKCIVGALILLFLGSLFLSGDFDASELSDGEQSQDWLSGDPQDMKELLDKLTQENQHIAQLEAQLQSQREELDSALRAVAESGDESGKADLESENAKLKEELSSLPELKTELESLRARVTELNQLTVDQKRPPASPGSTAQPGVKDGPMDQRAAGPEGGKAAIEGGGLKEELQRQSALLEESRKRLQGMKKDGGGRKRVRESLEEIQKKLSEQVERWGKKKPQDLKWKGNKGQKNGERDHWKKEEKKKERKGEKERKHNTKEGGRKDKEEKKEKEWKAQKQNSHKEAWRKHQDEWERKKDERRVDREERRKEKPWHSQPSKKSHHHNHNHPHQHQHQHQHQQPRQTHQHNHNSFWSDQEQKLRRNFQPQPGCSSVDECAGKEGLYAVELSEFEELLEGYLSKLEGSSPDSKDKVRKLTAEFFEGGVFVHDRVRFADFAEDVADVLEDMVDMVEGTGGPKDNDSLEEEMEEFEREALWKFAATA